MRTRGCRVKPIGEILRFVGHQSFAEFHDAHRVRWYAVIAKYEFSDPEIAVADNSPDGKTLLVWLEESALLNVVSTADPLTRLRIMKHSILAVDFMFDLEITRVRSIPMALQRHPHGSIIHLVDLRVRCSNCAPQGPGKPNCSYCTVVVRWSPALLARLLHMSHGLHMTEHVEMNRRNWDERAAIHARDTTGDYMLDRFRAGEDALHAIEAAELGDISGKRVLHLQCHIGQDTLCLVRRGATATGLDFSSAALSVARRLSDETGLKADFVEGTVYQAPDLTPGPFDLVFTTWGTICWLPDVKKWAEVIASVLAPSGELYFADAHPGFSVLEEYAGRFVPTYDYQTPPDRPLHFANETTYTGDPTIMSHQSTREWIHSLSAVLGGLIDAGLTITMFREHEALPWRGLTSLVPASERMWRLPDGVPRIPLSYSVRAKKGL